MTKPSILGFQLPNMPQPPNMRAKLDDELARQRYIEQVKQMQEQMREYALQNAERFEQEKLKYAQQLEDMKNAASEVMEQELNRRMGDLGRTITNAIKQGISEAVQEVLKAQYAPLEVVRDPETGRMTGARRMLPH